MEGFLKSESVLISSEACDSSAALPMTSAIDYSSPASIELEEATHIVRTSDVDSTDTPACSSNQLADHDFGFMNPHWTESLTEAPAPLSVPVIPAKPSKTSIQTSLHSLRQKLTSFHQPDSVPLSNQAVEALSTLQDEELRAIDAAKRKLEEKKARAREKASGRSKASANKLISTLLRPSQQPIVEGQLSASSEEAWKQLLEDEDSQKVRVKEVYESKRRIASKAVS